MLRSLLDVAVARARAAESLIARFGRDASAPALLVVALEARAACSVDGDEAAGHLMHAARVAEDVLGDGAKAFDLALASLARVTDGSVRRVAEEAVRLARALDRGPELVRALDARVTATDEPRASAETVDVALTVGERLGATPQTMLAWLDASIALVGAQADRLEQRLVYARAAGDPERVLEALDRLEPLRVSVDDRFDAERERIEALDAVGRGDAAIEAGFRALALRVERSLVTAMRARLAVGPRVDDALRLEEIVREDGGASVELRVESLLVSIAIASGVSKDVARACGYLEEALALAPNDASVGAAATGLLAIASAEDPAVRASAARALERSALARGDYEAVVEAREALVAIDRDDVALLEALAEARLTRGDRPEAVAPLWVEVVCRAPGHRRAFGAIASLEAPEARLKAAEALAAWLDAQSFDDDETAALCDWVALELVAAERRDRARPFLLRAYRANPTERAARFGLLDELLAEGSETPTRVELHRERAQETLDVATRFERLLTLADLEEQRDGHARTARATYEEALEIGDFDLAAVAALERVYAAEEDWRALVDLLARRLERTPSASDRARIRARQATVALEKLGACDEALDVVLAWLEDTRDDHRARHDALGWVERLLANERVRGRVAVECEPLLGAADGAARARVLEVAAELEPTRADAARWWLARVRHGLEAGDGLASASVDALARAFSGDPTSAELRALAGQVAARGVDWSEIARACEATIADLEPWERRDAVLALVAVLDEDAGDARGALALLDAATAEPDADDALHVKADELSMIVADWRRNVRALQRRAAATLDGEVRIDCLRRASSVAEEELEDRALALALAQELLVDGEQVDDLARAARLARAVPDGGALRRLLPRLLDARAWSGEDAEGEALELVDAMLGAGEAAEGVLEVIGRALDAGLPRPRLAAKLLEVLRASARHEDLASALEVEAERAVDPTAAAAAWDERSIVCGRALGDADAAFEAARRACDAAPSEARFARLVDTARHDARLLEDAIAFVESASGPGRDAAEWALLDAALGSFEGDARLAVARRLGAAAWSAGRAAKAAEAWLVALELDPAEDPFEESLEERIAAFGPEFLPRYAEVLGAVEREALDPGVAASAALRRGALLVERMDRRADALPSLRHAERADVDPPRVARLVVRALESGAPSKEFAEALDRATAVADGAERAALALRAARAWAGVEAPTGVVLERVEAAIEASDDACAQAEDLLVASLDDGDCFARAAERLEALYRARGDRAGRIALKRKAVAFAEHASDRLRALVELARTIDDLDGAPEDSLGAIVDAASIDAFDDDVFAAFVDVLGRRPSTEVALPRIVAALRAQEDGRAGWVRYALVLAERGSLPLPPRAELLRAAVSADPESAEALAALEAALVLEAPGAELVAVLMRRAQVELDPEPRATFLRRALAIATETLADAALAETVLAGWAEIDEGPELFACRVAEADRTGNAEAGLAWSRRAAEEAFDPDAQTALWRAHLDRAERLGAWGETLSALERLLAVDPADGSLQTRQRAALRASGDLDGLARAYEDHAMTAEDEGRRVVLTLELAELCERSTNDLARAREALRRAVDGGAREEEALDAARAFAARNRDDAWFVEVLEAASDAAVARGASARAVACLTEAASLLEGPLGDASGALERLERARAIAPAGDGLASHLVRIARHLERWELAIDVLEERVARDPSRGSFADLVATADASREGWLLDRALDVWRRLSFDAADLEDALYRALVREERVDEAHAFLRERTERLRGAGRAREAATLVRDALGATGDERPLGLLELAVQVDPEDVDASFELAVRFAEDGRGDDARAVLEAALPTLHAAERIAHAHLLLGRIARDRWDLDRARRHLTKAHGAAPDWSLALRELAAAAQEAGDVGEAFTHWKALLLLPLDESGDVRRSDALVGLARLYEDEGERAKASELYAHALAAAPDHEEAARGAARTR